MSSLRVECENPSLGLFNLRTQTGNAFVVLALSESELDALVAQARDAKATMQRWRRDNPVPGAWYPQ